MLKIGEKIPEFSVKDHKGNIFNSHDYIGKKSLVLYFYPKSFTRGCTKEAKEFKITEHTFQYFNAEVLGVSPDSVKNQQAFHEQLELTFRLLSDPKAEIAQKLGVKKQVLGLIGGRETLVFDKKGILRMRFRQLEVLGHVEKALDTVKELYNEK